MAGKTKTIGFTEKIRIFRKKKAKSIIARIDSGATKSSIDVRLAAELELGPIYKTKIVRSAHGNTLRPVIKVKIKMAGKDIKSDFTIADRTHMKYQVLIGQNILKELNFLIDPNKK